MRDLCTTKKYDLSQLNDEQLQAVLTWLKEDDIGWRCLNIIQHKYLSFLNTIFDNVVISSGWYNSSNLTGDLTNALELFEEEPNGCEITFNSMGRVEPKYPNYNQDEKNRDIWEELNTHHLQWDENRKGFFWTERPDYTERLRKYRQQKTIDVLEDFKSQENIYERADKLMQDGKKHGLKIVVTFEKL